MRSVVQSNSDEKYVQITRKFTRHPEYGLVGAMDDDDTARAQEIAPDMYFKRIDSDHVIHSHKPEIFTEEVKEFVTLFI